MALKSYALTTVQRAADFIGLGTVTAGSVQYTILEALVNAATDQIEAYIGHRVKKTTYTSEEYHGSGGVILLNHWPLIAGEAVTVQRRLSGVNESNWETVDTQYYYTDAGAGVISSVRGVNFSLSNYGYRVSYVAGYDYDNVTTFLSDVADGAALELACWMLVATLYQRRAGGGGVVSETIDKYSVTYAQTGLMSSPDIMELLDMYRRVDFPGVVTPPQI